MFEVDGVACSGAAGLESLCLEWVEQVGCGRLGGQLPGVDLAGSRPDQVQVDVGDVGAGEQERQPVPAAGGAGGCPGDDEQGPGLQVQGGLFAGFAFRRHLRAPRSAGSNANSASGCSTAHPAGKPCNPPPSASKSSPPSAQPGTPKAATTPRTSRRKCQHDEKRRSLVHHLRLRQNRR